MARRSERFLHALLSACTCSAVCYHTFTHKGCIAKSRTGAETMPCEGALQKWVQALQSGGLVQYNVKYGAAELMHS